MMPYKAQVSNASRLGATKIAVPFERNRRVELEATFSQLPQPHTLTRPTQCVRA